MVSMGVVAEGVGMVQAEAAMSKFLSITMVLLVVVLACTKRPASYDVAMRHQREMQQKAAAVAAAKKLGREIPGWCQSYTLTVVGPDIDLSRHSFLLQFRSAESCSNPKPVNMVCPLVVHDE